MSVKPILFSGPMVKALLEGRKTQTRRVLKPQPDTSKISPPFHPEHRGGRAWVFMARDDFPGYSYATADFRTPYAPGDILYVRETFGYGTRPHHIEGWQDGIEYRADQLMIDEDDPLPLYTPSAPEDFCYMDDPGSGWKPSIHMPRWASRITLPVTNVRVERLQDMTPDDAAAEGIRYAQGSYELEWLTPYARDARRLDDFRKLWDSMYDAQGYGWDANPWISVTEWKEIHLQNVDDFLKQTAA